MRFSGTQVCKQIMAVMLRIQSRHFKMAMCVYYLSLITDNLGRSYALISTLQLRKEA